MHVFCLHMNFIQVALVLLGKLQSYIQLVWEFSLTLQFSSQAASASYQHVSAVHTIVGFGQGSVVIG
jgi:hypothetical protein